MTEWDGRPWISIRPVGFGYEVYATFPKSTPEDGPWTRYPKPMWCLTRAGALRKSHRVARQWVADEDASGMNLPMPDVTGPWPECPRCHVDATEFVGEVDPEGDLPPFQVYGCPAGHRWGIRVLSGGGWAAGD
jgi:hypothetical protein